MRGLLVLLLVTIAVAMATETGSSDEKAKWKEYKMEHNKNYEGEEDERRFGIYSKNKAEIEAHNKLHDEGKVSYRKSLNKFSDWTQAEIDQSHGFKPNPTSAQ